MHLLCVQYRRSDLLLDPFEMAYSLCQPRTVVRKLFYIFHVSIKHDYLIYPSTLSGAHLLPYCSISSTAL